jgi:hypothetical protein
LQTAETAAGLETSREAIVSIPAHPDEGSVNVSTALGAAGLVTGLPYLRMTARLYRSSDGAQAPVFMGSDLSFECLLVD